VACASNVSPVHPPEAGLAERLMPHRPAREALRRLGWQLDFLFPGWLTEEMLPRMAKLRVDFTMAHMGCSSPRTGPGRPAFAA